MFENINTFFQMQRQLFDVMTKKQKKGFFGVIFVILVGSVFELLGISAIIPLIKTILDSSSYFKNEFIAKFLSLFGIVSQNGVLIFICTAIILLYLIKNVVLAFSSYLQIRFKNSLLEYFSVEMFDAYLHQPYSFFLNTNSGDIIRGVTTDTSGVHNVVESFFKLLAEGLCFLFIGIYLFYVDFVLASIIVTACICVFLFVTGIFKKKVSELGKIDRKTSMDNNNFVVQIVNGIKEIFVTQNYLYFFNKYKKSFNERKKACIANQFINSLPERIIELFAISSMIIAVGIRLLLDNQSTNFIPSLAVFSVAAFRLLPSTSRMTGYIQSFVYNRVMLESFYYNVKDSRQNRFLSTNPEQNKTVVSDSSFKEISISNISWKYNENLPLILDNVSLNIKKGESIGIIGESGAGKSTLADILLGLYTLIDGEICLDNVNINKIQSKWSQLLGYVPQSVFLFDDTIRENILFGQQAVDDSKIWEVLELANLKDFVQNLPLKLDTVIGENGIRFSGGQRQRIAIARALYSNPSILVFDEATSALDNETEKAIIETIEKLQGDKTLFIIAHRLSTIKKCDKIYEIKNKKIILKNKEELFLEKN